MQLLDEVKYLAVYILLIILFLYFEEFYLPPSSFRSFIEKKLFEYFKAFEGNYLALKPGLFIHSECD